MGLFERLMEIHWKFDQKLEYYGINGNFFIKQLNIKSKS